MKMKLLAGAALACLAIGLSGCAGMGKVDLPATISALASAGCKGAITNSVTATTAAGLSPGSLSVTHTFAGSCDPANAVRPAAGVVQPGQVVGSAAVTPGPAVEPATPPAPS